MGPATTTRSRFALVAACLITVVSCSSSPSTPTSSHPRRTVSFQERTVLATGSPTDDAFRGLEPVCREAVGCPGVEVDPSDDIVAIDRSGSWLHLGPAVITGEDVAGARAVQVGGTKPDPVIEWAVTVELTPEGTTAFADATTAAASQPSPWNRIAIMIDGVVVSAPAVVNPITSGEGEIAGDLTEDVAEALAASIGPVSVSS